jgi:hypothetical protein
LVRISGEGSLDLDVWDWDEIEEATEEFEGMDLREREKERGGDRSPP